MRLQVPSLAFLSGLRIWCCRELWYRSQTWLGSHVAVAVAVADRYSSDSTPSLGTSICHTYSPKKKQKKKGDRDKKRKIIYVRYKLVSDIYIYIYSITVFINSFHSSGSDVRDLYAKTNVLLVGYLLSICNFTISSSLTSKISGITL